MEENREMFEETTTNEPIDMESEKDSNGGIGSAIGVLLLAAAAGVGGVMAWRSKKKKSKESDSKINDGVERTDVETVEV